MYVREKNTQLISVNYDIRIIKLIKTKNSNALKGFWLKMWKNISSDATIVKGGATQNCRGQRHRASLWNQDGRQKMLEGADTNSISSIFK